MRGAATASAATVPIESRRSILSVTNLPSPSSTAERGSSERRAQPESLPPSCILVVIFAASLKNIPIRSCSPIMVPTNLNGGASGVGDATAGGGGGGGAVTTAGGGGRRDALNSGRSRVAESGEMVRDRSGLPGGGAPGAGGGEPAPASVVRLPASSIARATSSAKTPRFRTAIAAPNRSLDPNAFIAIVR